MAKKIGINVRTNIETTKRYSCLLNQENLLELLRKDGVEIPKGATVQFVVPGGGDWSGQAIDIDDENPVTIEWTIRETEGN